MSVYMLIMVVAVVVCLAAFIKENVKAMQKRRGERGAYFNPKPLGAKVKDLSESLRQVENVRCIADRNG